MNKIVLGIGPAAVWPTPCDPLPLTLAPSVAVVAVVKHAWLPTGYSLRKCSIAALDRLANIAEHASVVS
jgi:hypothetical protein